jgi:hypothetical protein
VRFMLPREIRREMAASAATATAAEAP